VTPDEVAHLRAIELENRWLHRLVQWCLSRLDDRAERDALNKYLSDGPYDGLVPESLAEQSEDVA
jgi:hypothetical protein